MIEIHVPDGFPVVDDEGRGTLACLACGRPVYTDPDADTDTDLKHADGLIERCACDRDERTGYRFLDKSTALEHIDEYLDQ